MDQSKSPQPPKARLQHHFVSFYSIGTSPQLRKRFSFLTSTFTSATESLAHHGVPRGKVCSHACITNFLLVTNEDRFNHKVLVDPTPMPSHIPAVEEIGASSAPLMSASFFIGARCRPYNDDYMQCKTDAHGRGEIECLKEGRKVTRCAASVYVASFFTNRNLGLTTVVC